MKLNTLVKRCFFCFVCLGHLLFTGCKKYPEGGWHYNYLKHLNEKWKLVLFEVNGIDSTNLIPQAHTAPDYLNNFAGFASIHTGKRAEIRLTSHSFAYPVSINNNKRDVLQIYNWSVNNLNNQRNVFAPLCGEYFDWKIEKLTKDELILISVSYNYKLIFIKE